jgi:hypothetical protein
MRLRYGWAELMLVQPHIMFAPPLPADAPHVLEAVARAARDEAAGGSPRASRSMDETMASLRELGRRQVQEAGYAYARARDSTPQSVPPPWPIDLALFTAEALLGAIGTPLGGWPRWHIAVTQGVPKVVAGLGLERLRTLAGRRRARRLGLRAMDAPRPQFRGAPVILLASTGIVFSILRRLRGDRYEPAPWWLTAAGSMIRQLDGRRAWNRAYAASRASSSQARLSAPSSAGAGWAPDTP